MSKFSTFLIVRHTPDACLFSSGVSGCFLVVDRVTRDVSIADGISVPIDHVTETELVSNEFGNYTTQSAFVKSVSEPVCYPVQLREL